MNLFFIERYIQKIKKEDIYNYAKKQQINLSNTELEIIYNYLKTKYKTYLYNKEKRPQLLTEIKTKVSFELANKLDELYYQYKDKI